MNSFGEVSTQDSTRLMSMGRVVKELGGTVVWTTRGCKLRVNTERGFTEMTLAVENYVPYLTSEQFETLRTLWRKQRRRHVERLVAAFQTIESTVGESRENPFIPTVTEQLQKQFREHVLDGHSPCSPNATDA